MMCNSVDLPRAARPHNGHEFALGYVQVYVAQHIGLAGTGLMVLFDVVHFDHDVPPCLSYSVRSVSIGLVSAARIA